MKKKMMLQAIQHKDAMQLTPEEMIHVLNSSLSGISSKELEERRERYGSNRMSKRAPFSMTKEILASFFNPFTLVLLLLAFISYMTDVVLVQQKDVTTVIVILFMVILSGVLRIVQETKSSKAADKLQRLVQNTTCVQRQDTGKQEIRMEEVVVGDIIHLAAGDFIPADLRILYAKDLFVSQASLTGESEPIEKLINQENIAYMGSNVSSGTGIGIVIAVGSSTMFGNLALSLQSKKKETSFDTGIKEVSKLLMHFMMVMVPVVFLVNGVIKHDFLQALLFALSIAVGLTPEMLPMIVTTTLAKGASVMGKKKTIVKNLSSIQSFGAMDILCTDKTGTLTKDKVELELHLNVMQESDLRVLRYAYANSYYQSGLKNLMDVAVLEKVNEENLKDIEDIYTKTDEIPFDFHRRRMSVVIQDKQGEIQLVSKGAIEEMLAVCTKVELHGEVLPLDELRIHEVIRGGEKLNKQGMRVLGLARKTDNSKRDGFCVEDEADMIFMGYLAFLDPAKESARHAIQALHQHGVEVKVLTGDNDQVASYICKAVGIKVDEILLGSDMEQMDTLELSEKIKHIQVFAKLNPLQKEMIVALLKQQGHTVGFMGDGINDAGAMKISDIGISVDNAVDIAKESADIILLEKDLMVLEEGILEGRKIFTNMMKYIKMTVSGNFGNMISVLAASIFLPFLPLLPIQILVLNLLYDITCIAIPWDKVDGIYLKHPKTWDAKGIKRFMFWMGPVSSIFDIMTFLVLYFIICPSVCGNYPNNAVLFMAVFQAGWFVESLCSQILIIHCIRTDKLAIWKSKATGSVTLFTSISMLTGILLPYTFIGEALDMSHIPMQYYGFLIVILMMYMGLVTLVKRAYLKRYPTLM